MQSLVSTSKTPAMSMIYETPEMPDVRTVKITADSQSVVVAYLNQLGTAIDVREYSVRENDELRDIVHVAYFDDVWNIDLVLALVDIINPDLPCGELVAHAREVLKAAS